MVIGLICAAIVGMLICGLLVIFLMFNSAYGADEMRQTFPWWPAEAPPRRPSDVELWGGP